MNVICLKSTHCKFDLKFSIVVWVLTVLLMESKSRNKLLLIPENSLKLLRHSPHQYTENCLGTFELTNLHSFNLATFGKHLMTVLIKGKKIQG